MIINRFRNVWRVQWTDWNGERQTRDVFSEKAAQAVADKNRPDERPPNWRAPGTNLATVPTLTDDQVEQLDLCKRRNTDPSPELDRAIQERIRLACAEIRRQQNGHLKQDAA